MKGFRKHIPILLTSYIAVFSLLLLTIGGNRIVTAMSENRRIPAGNIVIIDAGHGGVDGGATSCSGILESQINLEIALKLEDLMNLIGIRTKMIRTDDRSIYTEGESIAAKKVSDLKERVRIVNETNNALLISLHQDYFSDGKYYGAQTFYSDTDGSKELACELQTNIVKTLNIGSKRSPKRANGVYLMEHIEACGVLLECGFISNAQEEKRLCSAEYQRKLCCVIACTISSYIYDR